MELELKQLWNKANATEKEVFMGARGRFAWQILEKERVIQSSDFSNNFIFDWGLDQVASMTWAKCFEWCRIGNVALGSIQSSSARNTSLLYSLQQEQYQSNSYFTGVLPAPYSSSGCLSQLVSGSGILMRRTYDFSPESADRLYTEIGWSPNQAGNLFSRIIPVSGTTTGVNVLEGQSIRVIYELNVFSSPTGQVIGSQITGLSSAGKMGVQLFGLSSVGATGNSTFFDLASGANEPSVAARGFISDNATALATIGSKIDRTSVNMFQAETTLYSYTAGSFSRRKRFFIPASSGVYSNYNSIGIGASQGNAATNNSFTHVFSTPVNKQLDYIMNVNFYYNWGRLT